MVMQSAWVRLRCMADKVGAPPEPVSTIQISDLLSELLLVVLDGLHLRGRGTVGIELVGHPLVGEALGQLKADNALAEAENLGIVAEDGALNGEGVVGSHSTDAAHLVGGNGDSQTGAADEESTVSLAIPDKFGTLNGRVRVGGLVRGRVDTNIEDLADIRVLLEDRLEGILVGLTSLVGGEDDAKALRHCG